MNPSTDKNEKTWGFKTFSKPNDLNLIRSNIPDYSSWGKQTLETQDHKKRGIVIWDSRSQKIGVLRPVDALRLLCTLRTNHHRKIDSVSVTEPITVVYPDKRRVKKAKDMEAGKPESEHQRTEKDRETMTLDAIAALELYEYLEKHESHLQEMAAKNEEDNSKLLAQVYSMILSWPEPSEDRSVEGI